MEQVVNKIMHLNWLKWLPLVSNLFFLILFCTIVLQHGRISNEFSNGFQPYVMLAWNDFFYDIEFVLVVSTICSFFIKNKRLKWLSVMSGIITFIVIVLNIGQFNPW